LWAKCPAAYRYKHVEKLPEPASPAMERGRKIHKEAEDFINGKIIDLPASLSKFSILLQGLRDMPAGLIKVEAQMAFDRDNRPVSWFGANAYSRMIWDVGVYDEKGVTFQTVDFKTGKPYGSYDDQIQIFALPAFWTIPTLQTFTGHLIYLDNGDAVSVTYNRAQMFGPTCDPAANDGLQGLWRSNVAMMEADQAYRPKPSRDACRFCHFSAKKGGPCQEGVS
jgi:hypothetical protein